MNSLIYLAYGLPDLINEGIYSILSYQRLVQHAPVQILIYTDQPAEFQHVLGEQPHIHYPVVSPEQWQAWRGSRVYLLKIEVLKHAAKHYPGNLLFVDTDTIWQQDPAPVFQAISRGQRYMHVCEGVLAQGNYLSQKIYRHLHGKHWQVNGRTLTIDPDTKLYNSGVLGFPSQDAHALDSIKELGEQLYATYNKHIMEQLAFSMWFQTQAPIAEAAPYVLHYWNLKEIRPVLTQVVQRYASQGLDVLYKQLTQLNIAQLHQQELAYRNLPSWRRTLLKLQGRRWRLPAIDL
ncbi:hypothetical protein J0X19_20005 [Hymenobacter sp. BT186]|uniref:Nucleotide-diphospho-sugar transferase domain-containing protein n=1 Tax=Hymenobacter telluris TaxID=2816474 RepID=A0A939EYP0_9BACT|nr:hypothetical protein [Hymenobacter telluris]MBO0360254.1 hypothetical protein [Hymenobacter telluris]MBW3376281.1 hypothetical protein [Hymenobacter norwichensis]